MSVPTAEELAQMVYDYAYKPLDVANNVNRLLTDLKGNGEMYRRIEQTVKGNSEIIGKIVSNGDKILWWTGAFGAISTLTQTAQIGQLIYAFVTNMYRADRNENKTDETLKILQEELALLNGNSRKLASLVTFLGGATALFAGTSLILGLNVVYLRTRKKSKSASRRRISRSRSSVNRQRAEIAQYRRRLLRRLRGR